MSEDRWPGEHALSVLIACSRPRAAAACLAGLERQATRHAFEVIVAGDVQGLRREAFALDLTLIACADSHPNARRNLAYLHARAPRIALLDDDTIPDPDWVETAVECCAPDGRTVATGPERPLADGPASRLVFAVSANRWSEGTRAHWNPRPGSVGWTEVPFCNCVLPRGCCERFGPFSTAVPWDMDDFEFFLRARQEFRFENVPRLSIRHDRFPDSVRAFLADRWRLRVRTGEKLLGYPRVYARLLPLVAVAFCPWVVAGAGLAGVLPGPLLPAAAAAYLLLLLAQLGPAVRSGAPLAYLAILFGLHLVTVLGVQVGLFKFIFEKFKVSDRKEETLRTP